MNANNTATAALTKPASGEAITDVEEIAPSADTRGPIRLGFWVLVVGFGLFLAWAAWAPLDEGVAAPATVSVETRRKTIQHMQGGVIKKVAVTEGMEVKAGDLLVALEDAAGHANFESARQVYLAQRALESRLLAEASGAANVEFHSDLVKSTGDAIAAQHMAVQAQLFQARKAALAAELGAGQQIISGMEAQAASVHAMLESRRAQQALQTKQAAGVRALADEGFAPRNQALQLEQAQAELRTSLTDLEASQARSLSSAAETRLRLAQRRQEFLKEVSQQLYEVRREVQANKLRMDAISEEVERLQIKSPIAGQVIGLQLSGVGGVVTPGQRMMDILPRGESLLLDIKVPPQSIDRVKVGDSVEVRMSAFANSPQLVVDAKVVKLAGDAVIENVGNVPTSFYIGRVEITPAGMKSLGSRQLQPGMSAEVLIRTGQRSLLTYLLHPMLKRMAASMKEE